MLFLTNRQYLSVGIGCLEQVRKGGYRRTPIEQKIPTFDSSDFEVFPTLRNLKFLPSELHHITQWSCWHCGSECGIFDSSPFFIVDRVLQLVEKKNRHHIAWLPTSQDSSLFLFFSFLASCTIFSLFVFKEWCRHVNFAQSS